MTQIFTQTPNLSAKTQETQAKDSFPDLAGPSQNTLQNILNFSKNLEVKTSKFLEYVEMMKS